VRIPQRLFSSNTSTQNEIASDEAGLWDDDLVELPIMGGFRKGKEYTDDVLCKNGGRKAALPGRAVSVSRKDEKLTLFATRFRETKQVRGNPQFPEMQTPDGQPARNAARGNPAESGSTPMSSGVANGQTAQKSPRREPRA
jgi:hypothetical protein